MKKKYTNLFKRYKDYIKINREEMKIDFDLFASKIALSNASSFFSELDEKSAKTFFVSNLKNYKELKNQKRLIAQKGKK